MSEQPTDKDVTRLRSRVDYYIGLYDKLTRNLHDAANHIAIAHAKIIRQKEEIRLLNAVIVRRKRTARRLRFHVDAVGRLHAPMVFDKGMEHERVVCKECCTTGDGHRTRHCVDIHGVVYGTIRPCWPCRTKDATFSVMMDAIDNDDHVIET